MIQPMSVSQNRRSPGRRSVWNATSSATLTVKPAVHVHRALRPAGRAARVRDEQRMLAVDRVAPRTPGRPSTRSSSVTSRPSCIGDVASESGHDHDGVHGRRLRDRGVGGLLHRHELAAPGEAVGGDERDRARVAAAGSRPRRRRSRRRSAGRARRASRPRRARRPSRAPSAGTGRPRRPRRRRAPRGPRASRAVSVRSSAHVQRAGRALLAFPDDGGASALAGSSAKRSRHASPR